MAYFERLENVAREMREQRQRRRIAAERGRPLRSYDDLAPVAQRPTAGRRSLVPPAQRPKPGVKR